MRVFPAVPSVWQDVSIQDLRAEGGFKVSAIRKSGVTLRVEIQATVDQKLRLRDPFKESGSKVLWNMPVIRDGDWLSVALKAGQRMVGTLDR